MEIAVIKICSFSLFASILPASCSEKVEIPSLRTKTSVQKVNYDNYYCWVILLTEFDGSIQNDEGDFVSNWIRVPQM